MNVTIFEPIKNRFLELSDKNTFDKECSFAIQHLQKNSYLAKSTPNSLLQAVLNIVQIGLTLNPVQKLAYLVPRYNNAAGLIECALEPSYQGLVKLLTDSGSVTNVYAHLVYSNDEFQQILGTENTIIHKPKLGNRGEIIGIYAVAILANGSKQVEVMEVSEINEIRDSSESYKSFKAGKSKSCIWNDWFEEMARKTVIKRIVKYLPKSTTFDTLAKAIDLSNQDYTASDGQMNMIESLLLTSTIAEERKVFIERNMNTYSASQARECISNLIENQVDPLRDKGTGSQTEIKNKLSTLK
jgi:recombination protein RecT